MTDTTVINPDQPYRMPDQQAVQDWRNSTPMPQPGGPPALAPQSPLSALGPPPAPTQPPKYPNLNVPPAPQQPTQQQLGPAPDAKEYQQNSMAFASAMAVLGAVASRFTRVSGTAALSAFAGALSGWKSGNLQAYEEAAKKWEQDTKATIENNKQIMDKYKLALENRKMNIDEQMSQIQLIATKYHDQIMYDAAASKNYTMVAQIYEKNWEYTNGPKGVEATFNKLREPLEKQRIESQTLAAKWASLEGQTELESLKPDGTPKYDNAFKLRVKGLIDTYGGSEGKGTHNAVGKSAIAQNRQQYINEYTAEHGAAPTSEQITQWEAERAGVKAEATAVGRRAGGLAVAVQEAHDTIPNVQAAAQKSAGKGLATWNAVENKWKVEKGDPDFAFYVQQMNSLINVYGRVISGGGKGTVSDLEHARQMLNPNMPLSAVQGALKGFTTEVDIAEKAPEKVRARMRGGAATPAETTDQGGGGDTGWGKAKVVGQ